MPSVEKGKVTGKCFLENTLQLRQLGIKPQPLRTSQATVGRENVAQCVLPGRILEVSMIGLGFKSFTWMERGAIPGAHLQY